MVSTFVSPSKVSVWENQSQLFIFSLFISVPTNSTIGFIKNFLVYALTLLTKTYFLFFFLLYHSHFCFYFFVWLVGWVFLRGGSGFFVCLFCKHTFSSLLIKGSQYIKGSNIFFNTVSALSYFKIEYEQFPLWPSG